MGELAINISSTFRNVNQGFGVQLSVYDLSCNLAEPAIAATSVVAQRHERRIDTDLPAFRKDPSPDSGKWHTLSEMEAMTMASSQRRLREIVRKKKIG